MTEQIKAHWEDIYTTKKPDQVSWTQYKPETSLNMIHKITRRKDVAIIDVGGGDSLLVDWLLKEGYSNITVLDISSRAISRAKARLGDQSNQVNWIVNNVLDFSPTQRYDIWHDRATFHFLTTEEDIETYIKIVKKSINQGDVILGTFSWDGPSKCSGLPVKQYDQNSLAEVFNPDFRLIEGFSVDHITPSNTVQNFIFLNLSKTLLQ